MMIDVYSELQKQSSENPQIALCTSQADRRRFISKASARNLLLQHAATVWQTLATTGIFESP
jgi:hypothetical protein